MHTQPADTALADAIVRDLTFATMPDGSHIRIEAKADAILAHFGFTEVPPKLRQIVAQGVRVMAQRKRRKASEEGHASTMLRESLLSTRE